MPFVPIDALDDPRLDPYRHLTRTNLTRWSGLFIAEGKRVVQRLVSSGLEIASLLVTDRREEEVRPWVPPDVTTYVVPLPLGQQLVGFNFHTGILGCGRRRPPLTLARFLARLEETRGIGFQPVAPPRGIGFQPVAPTQDPATDLQPISDPVDEPRRGRFTVVVLPFLTDPENLGAIIRNSASFGVDLLVLGPGCGDPFSRRVLRVSMGTAFQLPYVESDDLRRDLTLLSAAGFELAATVLDPDAEPLSTTVGGPRLALLFGNEADGLAREWVERCDRRLTIPMAPGTDSLNVSVASAIFLHHFA